MDKYTNQIQELTKREKELKSTLAPFSLTKIETELNEMQEKYDKAESSFLKNEYKRSIVQHEKHKKSLVELLNHKEVINLRLNSSLNLLKQLKLDTVRIKTISDINEPFAVKELNQKTEELSQYLEDFQEGINHLALEM